MPDKLSFSKDWNKKLNADYYTTIRLPNKKYTPGNELQVYCKDRYIYNAKVLYSQEVMINKLTEYMTLIDAGMCKSDFQAMMLKMYPEYNFEKYPLVIVLLKQLEFVKPVEVPKFIAMKDYSKTMEALNNKQISML